jgi:hemerythrin-like domain-containing protein
MEPDDLQIDPGFEALRAHRAELLEAMRALEQALAAPATGRSSAWAERVNVALVELEADFGEHVGLTEGPEGFYRALLATAPQLSSQVTRLTAEHSEIKKSIDRLLSSVCRPVTNGDVDSIRESATKFLGMLSRHRQRGADLVFGAYQTDIGGET